MQSVTYINAYGEALRFGGEAPVLLRSVGGLTRPDGEILRTKGAGQAGETFVRVQLPARSVRVQFDVTNQESREALYRTRMQIERVLSYGRSMRSGVCGRLVYQNDAGTWRADAVPDGAIAYGKRILNALPGNKVNFLCPDAYLEEDGEKGRALRMGSGGFRLPTALPVKLGSRLFRAELKNDGAVDAPLAITIYGTGESPRLINHTTGAELSLRRVIATGERLFIDTDPRRLTCALCRTDGSREDAWGYLQASGAVSGFVLEPGANDVEYVPSAASVGSRVEIAWRNRVEGV